MNTYNYAGQVFTEEEVSKRATEKGLSLEEYLRKNPKIEVHSRGKAQDSTVGPTMSQDDMGSGLDDGSSESVSWFDQTWFGRGIAAASTTGEATDLMAQDFSNIDMGSIQEFMKAKEQEAKTHIPSERMEKFQKKYKEEGSTWSAFFRGVKDQPGLLPELFVQSLGTQVGTLIDSPGASLAAAGTGAAGGAAVGAVPGAVAGFMGGLATSMEAALTFGELIETELKEEGKEFTDENIKALLEGPKGNSIRNRAIGRGLTIGAVEGLSGGIAGKAAVATKGAVAAVRGAKTTAVAAGTAGVAVEGVGGGVGEVLGRVVAGQEMDAAEIGFEAITGTTTAPINIATALKSAKQPTYNLNGVDVTYKEMKDFVETADDIDVAKAKIKIKDDFTGVGTLAAKKQNKAIVDSQIDDKVTDKKDRDTLIELNDKRIEAEANVKKKGIDKVPNAPEELATIQAEIDAIIGKYEGAMGIGETQKAQDVAKVVRENRISDTIAFAETQGKRIGKQTIVVDNNEQAQAAHDKIAKEMGLKAQDVTDADGFIVGDSIIINKDIAGRTGAINVGAHEVLHGVLAKHMQSLDNAGKKKLISSFKKVLSKNQLAAVTKRLEDNYSDVKGFDIETTEEWFTAFSDAIEQNEITFDEGVFGKIKNTIQEILRKFGIKKDFSNGRQAYNFLKDYSQSIKKNKLSSRAMALAGEGATITDIEMSVSDKRVISDEAKRASKTIDDIGRKATTKADYDAGVNLEAYDYLIDKKGLDGLILAQLMKNNIDVKADDANVNGVPLKDYMEDVRTKLIPDVLGFNPEKEVTEEGKFGLSGYINQRLIFRMGTVATKAKKTVTGRSLERPVGTTGKTIADTIESDVDESIKAFEEQDMSIAAQKKRREEIKMAEKSKAIRKHGVTAQDIKNIKDDVAESLTDPKLPRIDEFEWTQAFRDKVANKKSPLFKKIQKLVGTGDKFAQTLKDTRKVMFGKEGLPTSDLVQMEKMEKEKIFAELDYRATNQELIDEAIEKGLIKTWEAKTEKQGPAIYNRKYPSEKELLSFFGKYETKTVKGKETKVYVPHRGRRESYIINASNFFAQDAIADVLENKPKVYDTLVKNNAEKGLPSSKNPISIIKQRIDRDMNVMFSKSFGNAKDTHKVIFSRGLDIFNKNLVKYKFNVRRAFEETYPRRLFVEGKSKKLRNEIIQDLERYIGWYKRQEGTEVKPELSLQDYIQLELTSPELTVKDLRQAYNLSKKDIDFSNLDQIVSARVALLKIMQHPKMGKTRVIRFMKNLTEPTQLGNTDAVALSIDQVSAVDQVKETGKLQKKINRKKKQINDLKAKIKALKAKEQSTKKEEAKLLNAEKKLKEYQSPDYKRRAGYGILDDMADWNNNYIKQLPDDAVSVRDRNTQKPSLIVNKKGVDKTKYNELEKNAEADADFLIDLMDIMRELRAVKGPEGISTNDAAMIHMTLSSGMNTALAAAAKPRYIPYVGKNQMYTGKMRWEHMIPRVIISLYLAEYQNGNISKKDIKFLLDNFHVAALPLHLDKLVTKAGYQAKMHAGWSLKDIDGKLSLLTISDIRRYLNMRTFGKWDIPLFDLKEQKVEPKSLIFAEKGANFNPDKIKERQTINTAVQQSRSSQKESKGITVLDFDDTLATSKSLVISTSPEGVVRKLTAEEFAQEGADLLDQGWTHDFSEFSKVVDGRVASLFNKAMKLQGKFGPENMFVLTARPADSAPAIFEFLKANGLNIPLKNITGLANSTSEAKALWIADKVGEGFNDFYFADDALQNVQAVQNMLDQFDVKSKVQQAKVKFSKSMNKDFNDILENVTGIESKKRFSAIKARKRGESKGKFRFFIPPSHEDFVGLLYNFIGKGKEGNTHRDFFEKALIRPLNRAYRELNAAKQSIANDYKSLNKQFEDVKKKLTNKTPDGDFTYQDAIRVYLWDKHGNEIPGLSPTDQKNLVDLVMGDTELQTYAETLNVISKQEKYVAPTESWEAGDIRTDLDDATGRIGRGEFFAEFNENVETIFSQENLNKIEAAYGAGVVSAIKDMLYRIKTGQNRPSGQNKQTNQWLNYLNGSVAATMFFNARSAVLQQMSLVNFINYADNNIISAAKAFANQKQYWADWATIFNSDFMKQRRKGIKTDVNGAELAASVKGAKNPTQAAIKKLLELGFLPTQIGDNIAIATGGATFLRNRINTYLKEGMSKKEAEAKAFVDFEILAEATQQSARPDMVSQQQASPLGKVILAFQNVTSQFNRLGKKAFLDIKNRRITPGNQTQLQSDMSNLSRIAYYFAIQNLVFYSLQSALFMMMFDDDEEDKRVLAKKERVINGSIDSILRGSGVWGAAVSTLKNMAFAYHKERAKDWNGDEASVLVEALNVSPPLGIKARKIVNAERTLNYNRKTIEEMETFDIDNPQWSANTSYIEALTNVPLNRLYNKTQNVRESLNNQQGALERVLMFSGWSKWNLGVEDVEKEKKKQGFGDKKRTRTRTRTRKRTRTRTR